jgi:hypothetical protein
MFRDHMVSLPFLPAFGVFDGCAVAGNLFPIARAFQQLGLLWRFLRKIHFMEIALASGESGPGARFLYQTEQAPVRASFWIGERTGCLSALEDGDGRRMC